MSTTTNRDDPRLTHGVDTEPRTMAEVYLVLTEAERAKGFVRQMRRSYRHVGPPGPRYGTHPLTGEQVEIHGDRYAAWEPYPAGDGAIGRYWMQSQLDAVLGGCGTETRMGNAICETYAREPGFYGSTYCVGCEMHRPVNEFVWIEDGQRVGT